MLNAGNGGAATGADMDALGRVVQVDPVEPKLKAHGLRLKLIYHK